MTSETSVPTASPFAVRIAGKLLRTDDPMPTGRQLLDLAGKRPVEEHVLLMRLADGLLEDIRPEEVVDLRRPGVEEFLVFQSDRTFNFEIDGRRQSWGAPVITETKLRQLAGVDAGYRVWLERRREEDLQLEPGQEVRLDEPGVERFYTGRDDTTAGRGGALPQADARYIEEKGLAIETVAHERQFAVVVRDHLLPEGRFQVPTADILIVLPAGYPDVPPDMFFADPWLKRVGTDAYPKAADQPYQFAGRRWQRWSRHNRQWRPGIDGLHTMLRRVDAALRSDA